MTRQITARRVLRLRPADLLGHHSICDHELEANGKSDKTRTTEAEAIALDKFLADTGQIFRHGSVVETLDRWPQVSSAR